MKIRTQILISSTALVAIGLILVVSINFFSFRNFSKQSPETPSKVIEYFLENEEKLLEIDEQLKMYNIRLIPVQREFENSEDILNQTLSRSLGTMIACVLIVLLLSNAFTFFAAKKITTPLSELTKGAKRIGDGDFSFPIEYTSNDEFGEVCKAFNQMQDRLMKSQEQTQALEQARTDMIADISHDLRTPLTSVKGYIKGLQDGVANTEAKKQRYLDTAYRRACDMDILLERLFYVSKVETGTLPINKEYVDFAKILDDFKFIVTPELETIDASIETKITEKPCMLHLDYGQIQRVLSNFVENSVKYANVSNLNIKISLESDVNFVTVIYQDNGNGISEDGLSHLFDRFWRGDKARSDTDGSGLGLYICKYIVNSHGATIDAYNDNGLKFILKFPRKDG